MFQRTFATSRLCCMANGASRSGSTVTVARQAAGPAAAASLHLRLRAADSERCNYPFRLHTISLDSGPARFEPEPITGKRKVAHQMSNFAEYAEQIGSWHLGCRV